MPLFTLNRLSISIPVILLAHQIEEYYFEFPQWYSDLLNASLSDKDFLVINIIGFLIITGLTWSYKYHGNNMILTALASLIFTNGVVHLLLTLIFGDYSPGTWTGVLFFVPVSLLILNKTLLIMEPSKWTEGIFMGFLAMAVVGMIAWNI